MSLVGNILGCIVDVTLASPSGTRQMQSQAWTLRNFEIGIQNALETSNKTMGVFTQCYCFHIIGWQSVDVYLSNGGDPIRYQAQWCKVVKWGLIEGTFDGVVLFNGIQRLAQNQIEAKCGNIIAIERLYGIWHWLVSGPDCNVLPREKGLSDESLRDNDGTKVRFDIVRILFKRCSRFDLRT